MRSSFTKIFLVIVTCFNLFASEYSWSVHTSKNEAYVNEAIYLHYFCEFSDKADLYSVEFNPITDNEMYSLILLSEEIKIVGGKKINSYEFVVFVKKAIEIDLSFQAIMNKTTKASIENTVLGRDNIDYEESVKTVVEQENIHLVVKEIPTKIFGDFVLDVKADNKQVKAYEPYHLDITITGIGDFEAIEELKYTIKDVKVFSQKPLKKISLTKDGYQGSWNQKFAFVGSEDFTIPTVEIKYFDGTLKFMKIEKTEVIVSEAYKKEELLDTSEEEVAIDFSFVYYILTFLAGFLLAKVKFKTNNKSSKEEEFIEKIINSSSLNELSMLLVLHNQKRFSEILLELDSKKAPLLSKAKKDVLQLLEK